MSDNKSTSVQWKAPNYMKFVFGGCAGMGATLFVHPFDLVKNRMQMSGQDGVQKLYKSSFHAFSQIFKNEGVTKGIYSGLTAGLLRQATYATARLGIYTTLFEHYSSSGIPPSFLVKAAIACTAGVCGASIGNPAELVLIRMTSDGRLPPELRRGYSNAISALVRITREEGIRTLWRGCIPTMSRAAVTNIAQLASYSQAKQFLLDSFRFQDGIFTHFGASMISGLVTTTASLPVDIVKTRIQNMVIVDGKPEYSGAVDAFRKIIRKEGFFSLWKGYTPYYLRIGPHTVLTFIFLEQMHGFYRVYVLKGSKEGSSM